MRTRASPPCAPPPARSPPPRRSCSRRWRSAAEIWKRAPSSKPGTTRVAFLADIRANAAALDAVLAHAGAQGVTNWWNIGALLAHGPDPRPVAERVWSSPLAAGCLLGWHDRRILDGTMAEWNARARSAGAWTRAQVQPRWWHGRRRRALWRWLCTRPASAPADGLLLCAGTPEHPAAGVLETHAPEAVAAACAAAPGGAIIGAHCCPGVIWADEGIWRPMADGAQVRLAGRACIVCPGAVGQPHDGDPRAGYAIRDGDTITWHRVAYDVEATVRRCRAIPAFPDTAAERLRVGR